MKTFISYAKEDHDIAKSIFDSLKSNGIELWFDRVDLLPGQNWKLEVSKAIKESSFFIALLSSNSVSRRGFVQRELKIALEVLSDLPPGKIFIIPVRLDANCIPTEEAIKDLHWINLFDSFEDGIRRILRVLKPSKSIKNQAKKNRIIKTKFRAPDIAQFQIEQSTRFLNAKLSFISMLQQIDLHYEFTNRKFSIF